MSVAPAAVSAALAAPACPKLMSVAPASTVGAGFTTAAPLLGARMAIYGSLRSGF